MKKRLPLLILILTAFTFIFGVHCAAAPDIDVVTRLKEYRVTIQELIDKQQHAYTIMQSAELIGLNQTQSIYDEASLLYFETTQKLKNVQTEYSALLHLIRTQKIQELRIKETEKETPSYTQEDLDLLSKIIYQEAGCTWLSDEHQLLVGNVVLNRVASPLFPNTIKEVIYQKGQYAMAHKLDETIPDERTIENARLLLEGLRVCPEDIIWQAGFKQGKYVYKEIKDDILGTTTYFCG